MYEKLGSKALVVPVLLAALVCCVLSLCITPMLLASAEDVPFVIVNLDEGAVTAAGSTNVGETLTENLLSGDASLVSGEDEDDDEGSDDSTSSVSIEWTEMDAEEEALEALSGFDYYGAIVIPENFTSQEMSYSVGVGDPPEISVYLNSAKNAQMASTMQTTLQAAMFSAGVAADVETVNDADVGGGSLSGAMFVQMMVMPLMVMTLVMSILTSMLFWKNDVTGLRGKNRFLAAFAQLLMAVLFSAIAAGLALVPDAVVGGMDLPVKELYPCLWFGSFATMLLFMGLCDLCFPVGVLLSLATFVLGLSTAMLPVEMLPSFWADHVFPWAPQARIGQSIRAIVYFGTGPLEGDAETMLAIAAVGLAAFLFAALVPFHGKGGALEEAGGKAQGEESASLPEAAETEPASQGSVAASSEAAPDADSAGREPPASLRSAG